MCVTPANGKSKTSYILNENVFWPCAISSTEKRGTGVNAEVTSELFVCLSLFISGNQYGNRKRS